MRPIFSLLLLTAFLLTACGPGTPERLAASSPTPTSTTLPPTPALTSLPPEQTATAELPMPSPTLPSPTPTTSPTNAFGFQIHHGSSLPSDRPLLAYEAGSAQNKHLLLVDPAEGTAYEFTFPDGAHFATPFLAGLSPDARYFVYFEGGWLETLYDHEYLRASTPDLILHVLDLHSGEIIFSAPLLSPAFPQDINPIAEMIKDDWNFTHFNTPFEEIVAATQEFLLDHIRNVAWSPDGSLLAFASQNPGPSSDLYFFSPERGTAQRVNADQGHVVKTIWAPDSSVLAMETSFFERMAREDTTYLLSREGLLLGLFTSQVWFFHNWHGSTYGFLYGGTDAGDYFDLKTISAVDGMITVLWPGTYAEIAFSPDLSAFLVSSNMPTAPVPPHSGLYLGSLEDGSLLAVSENRGWGVAYWGSQRFAFAASSIDEGTIGVTPVGERVPIDAGYWRLAPSPDGNYLSGYHRSLPGYAPGVHPGLRIFDGDGRLLESRDDVNVTCASWNAASTALAYQVESRIYLWDAAAGSTRLVTDQMNAQECAFIWVGEAH